MTDHIGLGVLTRLIHRDLVDEVLIDTGKTERRHRMLPARVVVYFIMAMTLFLDDAARVARPLAGPGPTGGGTPARRPTLLRTPESTAEAPIMAGPVAR
jgi:hypothetical protein